MKRKKKRGKGAARLFLLLTLVGIVLFFAVGPGKRMVMEYFYPVKYQEYVEKYAQEYNLDKYLVYAVIKVESKFNADAASDAGAKGLMQLMDETAAECNEKGGFGYNIPEDLYDPEKNIRLGCYYLSSLMDIYRDSKLAVTAYNGGTGNVDEWLKDAELADGNGGLREIPYSETRKYVKKVFNAFDTYNDLYKYNKY